MKCEQYLVVDKLMISSNYRFRSIAVLLRDFSKMWFVRHAIFRFSVLFFYHPTWDFNDLIFQVIYFQSGHLVFLGAAYDLHMIDFFFFDVGRFSNEFLNMFTISVVKRTF